MCRCVPRAALQPQEVEDFRERLCRVATRRFAEHGHAGVSLRQLAVELGCSPMTPYRDFREGGHRVRSRLMYPHA